MPVDWDTLLNAAEWYIGEMKDWIPAFAENTPRLEQKGSGGDDGEGHENDE